MRKIFISLMFILASGLFSHANAQEGQAPKSIVQVQHQLDWLQPTNGPENTWLFMGYHVTFLEVGRFNFGGIGMGMGIKRMSPGYPYTPEPRQIEVHPLLSSHFGFRVMKEDNFWINVSYTYDPVRKASMVGFGLSANPVKPERY